MSITVGGEGPDARTTRKRAGQPLPHEGGSGQHAAAPGRAPGSGISALDATIDRSKSLRQSKRHTRLVRVLRLAFPALALITVGLYYVTLKRNWTYKLPNGGQIDFSSIGLNGQNLVVNNPRYRGYGKDGSSYFVTAKTGIQDMRQMDRVQLRDISGNMLQANRNEFRLWSKQGLFDNKKNELELWDHIYIEGDNGMKGWLSRAMVYVKDSRIISNEPVIFEALNGTINAETMQVNQKTHKAVFEGNVKVHILRKDVTAPAAKSDRAGKAAAGTGATPAATPTAKPKTPAAASVQLRPGQAQ